MGSFINNTIIPAASDVDVILLGDFKAYNEEDPIDVLREAGFINLFGPESYFYVFDNQFGSLDHALVTPSLFQQFTEGANGILTPTNPIFLDYNTEFKTAAQIAGFYQPNAFRSSDHDPVLVGLKLNIPVIPTISFANATAIIDEGTSTYKVNLLLSEATTQEATVTFSITHGTGAVYGTDYTTTPDGSTNSFTVTLPAGSTSASFAVNLINDQVDEANETVNFAITQVSGGVKSGDQTNLSLTIADNDVPVISFRQAAATINEGFGAYTVTLTSSIAPVTAQTVTIVINDYALQYGAKNDYVTNPSGTTGSFTLITPAGQTTASFTVTPDKNVASKKNNPSLDFTISQVSGEDH